MLRHLARTHAVHVGCLIDDPADWAHVPALRAHCAELACFSLHPRRQRLRALARLRPGRPLTLDYFHHEPLRQWVADTLARERIDRAFVYSSAMAPYVLGAQGVETVLDLVDVDSSKWTAYASVTRGPARLVWAREGRTLLAFERQAAARCDHALLVSQPELDHFCALAPEIAGHGRTVSNGVDLDYFAPTHRFADPMPGPSPTLVFTGAMDYRPNIEAVLWFADDVLPILAMRQPAPAFWIVGANPAEPVRRLAGRAGIHVTGRVPDTRPYLAHADAVVAPLRIARGIQNKVLEGLAMGRPVIATAQAAEGIRAVPGRDLLIGADAPGMAARIAEVLDGSHPALGLEARRAVEQGYDWSAQLAALDAIWKSAAPIRWKQPEVAG
jgi:sugar transferase (PEP-CTERM/EpsH1 system associated)